MFWTSLVVQWLKLSTANSGGVCSILVGEIISHMLHGVAKRLK